MGTLQDEDLKARSSLTEEMQSSEYLRVRYEGRQQSLGALLLLEQDSGRAAPEAAAVIRKEVLFSEAGGKWFGAGAF